MRAYIVQLAELGVKLVHKRFTVNFQLLARSFKLGRPQHILGNRASESKDGRCNTKHESVRSPDHEARQQPTWHECTDHEQQTFHAGAGSCDANTLVLLATNTRVHEP